MRYAIALDGGDGDASNDVSGDDLAAGTVLEGTLSWADGDTAERTIELSIADDALVERNERLVVSLDGADGAVIGSPDTLVLTLVDDDVAPLAPRHAALHSRRAPHRGERRRDRRRRRTYRRHRRRTHR